MFFPSLKEYDVICGGQFPVDHPLPPLLFLFLPFHICVCETTIRSFHESKARQLGVVCFPYLLASAAPQMSNLHFCPAGPRGILYLLPYMWTLICGVWLHVKGRGTRCGEQHALRSLGLTIIICDREATFSGSVEPHPPSQRRIGWLRVRNSCLLRGNSQHLICIGAYQQCN